ncbi:hypothetical protein COK25_29675 [Bacillus cereus]|nr:hypothetical protein CON66_26845 [Bacillus cereus]QWH69733.1 hypothetical protein EXW41_28975 [Bacillus wiedmannii]PED34439.1 hypothetical protein CON24_30215 [Bacillus cereus]PER11834.1 hypothetical protein CN489_13910 [Bacillus cereus]PEW59827.1 hypothetical protein CN438_10450 [Bacillus cereus]
MQLTNGLMKKEALYEMLQCFTGLSYVIILTTGFNMDLRINKLGNVSNYSVAIILNKNAIWYVTRRALRKVPFCKDYSI